MSKPLSPMDIKVVITDIDGVWTDGGMYYDQTGNELKLFNTSDSAGVLFCRLNDVAVAILTGEDTRIVANRAKKLGIDRVYQGVKDKITTARQIVADVGADLSEAAYIGDDLGDIALLRDVGYSASVPGAPHYIQRHADYITRARGGEGAFRDFVEHLLERHDLLEPTIQSYLDSVEAD